MGGKKEYSTYKIYKIRDYINKNNDLSDIKQFLKSISNKTRLYNIKRWWKLRKIK